MTCVRKTTSSYQISVHTHFFFFQAKGSMQLLGVTLIWEEETGKGSFDLQL